MKHPREFRRLHKGGILLGRNVSTGNLFGLSAADRRGHAWVPGASGGGKSNLLAMMAMQDILSLDGVPRGVTVIDWHGKLAHNLIAWLAEHRLYRRRTVRLIEPSNREFAFSLNPFLSSSHFESPALADNLTNAIAQVFGGKFILESPRTYSLLWELFHALATLKLTLCDARDFLRAVDRGGLRGLHLERLEALDEDGADFWRDLDAVSPTRRHEFIEPLASRLRPLLRSPMVSQIFGQTERALDLAQAMDDGEIIIINLKPGEGVLSELTARVIGTLLVNEFYTSCFRRKNVDRNEVPHYLIIDECQLFLTPDVANILDGARKFGLYLTLAHQHLGHLREAGEHIFLSVVTNTRMKCVFGGLGPDDAEYLARLMWAGYFDLQRPKAKLMRPQVVGHRLIWLSQEGESRGTAHAVAKNWANGQSETETETESDNWAQSKGDSAGRSGIDLSSISKGPSVPAADVPGENIFTGTTTGVVTNHGHNEMDMTGGGRSRGRASTKSSQKGGSLTDTSSRAANRGRGQALEPIYDITPTDVWRLEEEIHKKSVSLANTRTGEMHVRVGNKAPRRLVTPFVTKTTVSEERVIRVRRELLLATPYVVESTRAQMEYRAHRARLLSEAGTVRTEESSHPAFAEFADLLKARGVDAKRTPIDEEP